MNTRLLSATSRALALLLLVTAAAFAQTAKKPITQDLYDSWRALSGPSLSPDGKWTAYTAGPVVGEGELVVRSTSGATEFRVPRGFTGRPQMQPNADSGFTAAPAQFSADSRFVAFLQYAPKAQYDAVSRTGRGRGAATQPRNNLGIVSLADGNVTILGKVRSFRLARDGGKYIAYMLESDSAAPAGGGGGGRSGGGGRGGAGGGAAATTTSGGAGGARRDPGFTLVLRELATGTETKIEDVSAFTMDDAEKWLAYTTSSPDSTKPGAFVR
ncbi:MAG: hypothetical protein ACHQQR_16705, partial [Gemmatimonadales bacterium]